MKTFHKVPKLFTYFRIVWTHMGFLRVLDEIYSTTFRNFHNCCNILIHTISEHIGFLYIFDTICSKRFRNSPTCWNILIHIVSKHIGISSYVEWNLFKTFKMFSKIVDTFDSYMFKTYRISSHFGWKICSKCFGDVQSYWHILFHIASKHPPTGSFEGARANQDYKPTYWMLG